MAISVEGLFCDALLQLLKDKKLASITIQDLLDVTGASRQTFYNHFRDKNDLICTIYNTKIIPDYNTKPSQNMDFSTSLLHSFQNMLCYKSFLQQALLLKDTGNLKDYIFTHCAEYDLQWHQLCYGKKPMPDALKFATEYHAIASSSMTISWILSGMTTSCEEMVDMITKMRSLGMDQLFKDCDGEGNPYKK